MSVTCCRTGICCRRQKMQFAQQTFQQLLPLLVVPLDLFSQCADVVAQLLSLAQCCVGSLWLQRPQLCLQRPQLCLQPHHLVLARSSFDTEEIIVFLTEWNNSIIASRSFLRHERLIGSWSYLAVTWAADRVLILPSSESPPTSSIDFAFSSLTAIKRIHFVINIWYINIHIHITWHRQDWWGRAKGQPSLQN